jgi:hypothetical protein
MVDINSSLTIDEAEEQIRGIAKYGVIHPTYHYHKKGKNVRSYNLQL